MEKRIRPRATGITFGQLPVGEHNAITDVPGVKVGHKTVVFGDHTLSPGEGPARSGVTVILPNDDIYHNRVFAAIHAINGAGELTGAVQIQEWGLLETPIALTGSMNVGLVFDGMVDYMLERYPELRASGEVVLPVVGECNDGILTDPAGRHVKQHHVREAILAANGGPVDEGAVGGGTGMVCFEFKGGIGTSSRITSSGYTVGALVMTNFGKRPELTIQGVHVGQAITHSMPEKRVDGSIIIVIATDAPLLPHQLNRVARRAGLGLARVGSIAHHGSGDIAVAFSTGQTILQDGAGSEDVTQSVKMIKDDQLDSIFQATIEVVEESIINALFMAETMVGRMGTVHALPIAETLELIRSGTGQ